MITSYEIRECQNCGLRYPLTEENSFGTRCPSCLGDTKIVLVRTTSLETESAYTSQAVHLEALLDNIRSAWNVGSIFRTADGFGLKHLHLCGITPTPEIDSVKKTSLGSEDTIGWTYHKNAVVTAQEMKASGYTLWALEEDKRAISIQNIKNKIKKGQFVFIVGNEITGVDTELLDLCDEVFHIPMRGRKKSFNVAIAFGIACAILGEIP